MKYNLKNNIMRLKNKFKLIKRNAPYKKIQLLV